MTIGGQITVHGRPASQGSKRHVGNGVMIESSPRTRPWREAVKQAALVAWAGKPRLEGAVELRVVFFFDLPKSAPKRKRIQPITRSTGDLSKLVRAIEDSLVDAHVMRDDAQIVRSDCCKVYAARDDGQAPRAVIGVFEVEEGRA